MAEVKIYALYDPRQPDEVRYIGKAICEKKRLKSHIRDSRRRNTKLYAWIRKLSKSGMEPIIKVLMTVPEECWQQYEIEEIAKQRLINSRLLNIADGGNAPFRTAHQCIAGGFKINEGLKKTGRVIWAIKRQLGDNLNWVRKNLSQEKIRLHEERRARTLQSLEKMIKKHGAKNAGLIFAYKMPHLRKWL